MLPEQFVLQQFDATTQRNQQAKNASLLQEGQAQLVQTLLQEEFDVHAQILKSYAAKIQAQKDYVQVLMTTFDKPAGPPPADFANYEFQQNYQLEQLKKQLGAKIQALADSRPENSAAFQELQPKQQPDKQPQLSVHLAALPKEANFKVVQKKRKPTNCFQADFEEKSSRFP